MIDVSIHRNRSGLIQSFEISGHALFANNGEDIVCAGASAVSVGCVNSIHQLAGVTPHIQMESGLLSCILPSNLAQDIEEKVQLLLEGMVVSLQTIVENYPENIKITFKQ
ncbi:ribosomal-processing cysteine protease Prp [Cytobacillus sp. FSL W7-1323]|uniref:Ribosomal processing cysteine protease Prp n=1 Tax=Cytobacillus kochii TaxID=859143 RepID=A0A248TKV9_9BACI|nr:MULTISPECIES: ribosomal-processing cysteine protease Prp [Cytobacillus]ASV68843.1 hypothetical protein CKF48_17025 [Cytobacillus kochii]MDQ0183555.1 uncharacterized protein YsxB (DUF464 family) [Cytobacillus kochii]MEA1853269.1 ribosomal-processing cysteine protease Prp [Cytobacillus sp. OWB-43]MED1603867.1 ribosomal-processing cysteine protease Prp [Cytobacillus kochii]